MKTRHLTTVAVLVMLVTACVPSFHPFYFEKDLITDGRLVGEWRPSRDGDTGEIWKFEQDGDKALTLTVTEEGGKKGVFTARLFKIKQERFLDLTPKQCDFDQRQIDLVGASMIPGHLLVRVSQFEPGLKLAFFNVDWLGKHLEKSPRALAHRREGETMLLTASTAELQKFVMKHLGEGELFDEPAELVRNPKPAANN
jgi:hypothetical protein